MSVAGKIAKNSVFNISANASELILGLITGIVLARGLGTENYGLYAYLMWFISLSAVILNLGLGPMSKRFIAEASGRESPHERAGFAQLSLMLRMAATLVVSVAIIISSGYWARLSGDPGNKLLFVLVAFAMFPHMLQHTLIPIFRGFQKFDYVLYIMLATYPLRLGLIIVIMTMGLGVFEVLILHIAVLTLGTLVGFFLLRRLMPLKSLLSLSLLSSAARKRALKYSLTAAGVLILDFLAYQHAAVFFIGLYCPMEEVGFYTLACKFVVLLGFLPKAFAFVLLPAIAEQFGRGDAEKIKRIYITSTRYLIMMALPLAAGGIALGNSIVILLYGVDYTPAVILIQILVIPMAIYTIGQAAGAVIYAINRPDFILKINLTLAFVNIGLCLLLIPRYGVLGAVIAILVPWVLCPVFYSGFVSRKGWATWPVRDTIKIALASLVMGLAVYALQSQLGVVYSLALGIPLGIVIYLIAVFALRVVQEQDLVLLKGVKYSIPLSLRKYYNFLMGLMERSVVRTKLSTGQ